MGVASAHDARSDGVTTPGRVTRYTADWVLPISAPPIAQGEVEVVQGRIAYVGPRRDGDRGDVRPLGASVLLPGLVNAHTHLELTALRGFLEELEFRPWILRLTSARRAVISREGLAASARLGIAEGLAAGITTYADTCESGTVLGAMRAMGVRGIMYQEAFGPDPAQCEPALAALKDMVATLRPMETSLVRLGVSPHAPYTVCDSLFSAIARFAMDDALPIAVHAAEGADESRLVSAGEGPFAEGLCARGIAVAPRASTPIALLERTGVLHARPLLIHCVRLESTDIARIAGHDCAVAHCPASNAKLGHGIAPLLELSRAGVRIGLGSDSVASNNRMDILDEARVAALMQRARSGRPDVATAAEMLALATIGGARALGLDRDVGTLEVGKGGDLAAFALGDPRATPAISPADALLWAVAGRPASLTVVAGRELVRDGIPTGDLAASIAADRETVTGIGVSLQEWSWRGLAAAAPSPG